MDKLEFPKVFVPSASDFDYGPPDFSGVVPNDDPITES